MGLLTRTSCCMALLNCFFRQHTLLGNIPSAKVCDLQTLLLLTFANGVPMDNGTVAEKAFALAIAGSGLVAFALTVALIQQVRRSPAI